MKYYIVIFLAIYIYSCANNNKNNINNYTATIDTVEQFNDTTNKPLSEIHSIDTTAQLPDIIKIQNEIITPGGVKITFIEKNNSNEKVNKGDVVKIKYNAYLPNGKLFDSSDMIGMPLGFFVGIGMSVKGWDEALIMTNVGDKFRLHVPAKLAYGKKGYGKLIPPDADLDFDMQITEKMKPLILQDDLKLYVTLPQNRENIYPVEGSEVSIHYYAWTTEGKLFDATHFNGKPYKFKLGLGKSIEGWNIALKKIRKGEKAILVVPPKLGYGESGIPELVPPNATLVYMLELIDIK
jgi:peptidylprolyl isomerase